MNLIRRPIYIDISDKGKELFNLILLLLFKTSGEANVLQALEFIAAISVS